MMGPIQIVFRIKIIYCVKIKINNYIFIIINYIINGKKM